MNRYGFSPSDVEGITGWFAVGLRDLRMKGYLDTYGRKGDNGRWLYSGRDLVAFGVADVLRHRDHSLDLRYILRDAWLMAEQVAAHVCGNEALPYWVRGDRFEAQEDRLLHPKTEGFATSSIDRSMGRGFYAADVINIAEIAKLINSALRAIILKLHAGALTPDEEDPDE